MLGLSLGGDTGLPQPVGGQAVYREGRKLELLGSFLYIGRQID